MLVGEAEDLSVLGPGDLVAEESGDLPEVRSGDLLGEVRGDLLGDVLLDLREFRLTERRGKLLPRFGGGVAGGLRGFSHPGPARIREAVINPGGEPDDEDEDEDLLNLRGTQRSAIGSW